MFRKLHWNNRGVKSIVWRCISRLESTGLECHARTINELVLQDAVVKAINSQQTTYLIEFDEALVRRWIMQIVIWDDRITVELESGVSIDVDT